MPDCLFPPKGALAAKKKAPLTFIEPVRTRRATFMALSDEAEMTAPVRPYGDHSRYGRRQRHPRRG